MTAQAPAQAPAQPPVPPATAPSNEGAERLRGRLMLASVKALLDMVPGSRHVLHYVAALESTLDERGLAGVEALAPKVLERICTQLSSLPLPKDDAPLLDLFSRLLDLLEAHQLPQQRHLATFINDSKLMVMEGSLTDFQAAFREQADTETGEP